MSLRERIRNTIKWGHLIWNDIEWPLIVALIFSTTILGSRGFALYFTQKKITSYSIWDCIYSAIQLFSLESGNITPGDPLPLSLQIARFAAPALAAYTVFQVLKEVFSKQILLFNLLKIRKHYIVIGLGDKGLRLVNDLRDANFPVVGVEADENNPHLDTCRDMDALVLIGDARDKRILKRAGVKRARHLIAVGGDDGTNTEIAVRTRELIPQDLTCTIHITDSYLWGILKEQEFMLQKPQQHFRLELFNIYDSGARYLLRQTLYTYENELVLLIVGMGRLAEYLILHSAQFWTFEYGPAARSPLHIHVVDPLAKDKISRLQARYPLVKNACKLIPHDQFIEELDLNALHGDITHAYICLDDTFLGLQAGFSLLDWAGEKNVQVMVRMTEDAGLASLLKTSQQLKLSPLEAFGLLDATCKISLFDDGTHENLARAIHEHYLQEELSKGRKVGDSPSLQPWESLSDALRTSNLHQAEHIGAKLAAVGCGLMPWISGDARHFAFADEEIETMARMEHARWRVEKERQGWTQGERDNDKKCHPDLFSWEKLSEEAREKNRQAVRQIPVLLARAGFQIYRIPRQSTS